MKKILFFMLIALLSIDTYAQELEADDFVIITQENAAYPGFNARTYRGLFPVGHGQFKMFNYGGTPGNLSALGANETLGSFVFNGYDGNQNVISAVIQARTITDSRDPRFNFLLSNGVGNQRPNRMTILGQSGNVGIGITEPTERLDVDGNIRMRAGASDGYIPVSDADGVMTWTDPASIVSGSWTESSGEVYRATGNVGIGGNPSAKLHIRADGTTISDGIRITSSLANSEDWYAYMDESDNFVFQDDGTRTMTLQNSTGNVGIGTDTPDATVHVDGTDSKLLVGASGGLLSKLTVNAEAGTEIARFRSDGNTKLFIDSDGEVGIGNASPSAQLDVTGTTELNGNTDVNGDLEVHSNSSEIARFESSASSKWISIYDGATRKGMLWNTGDNMVLRAEAAGSSVRFQTAGNNNRMSINANGVGVGTTAPVHDIHIKQSSNGQADPGGIALESFSTSNKWKIYHSGVNCSFAENDIRLAYVEGGSGAWVTVSDARFKNNVKPMESTLEKVMELNPVSYQYNWQEKNSKLTLGFIAQEVQPLFPEMVSQGEDGSLGMTYATAGVIAIKAIQEQQTVIAEQENKIEALEKANIEKQEQIDMLIQKFEQFEEALGSCCFDNNQELREETITNIELDGNSEQAILEQNSPNPFNLQTEIRYYIPSSATKGQMMIIDNRGAILKTINLSETGFGTVFIKAGELAPGTYAYTLFVDGNKIATKQMILVK